jgi:hypothetical protein
MQNVHSYSTFFFFLLANKLRYERLKSSCRQTKTSYVPTRPPHKHAAIEFLAVLYKIIAKMPRCCVFVHYNNEKSTNTYFFSFPNKNKRPKMHPVYTGCKIRGTTQWGNVNSAYKIMRKIIKKLYAF